MGIFIDYLGDFSIRWMVYGWNGRDQAGGFGM